MHAHFCSIRWCTTKLLFCFDVRHFRVHSKLHSVNCKRYFYWNEKWRSALDRKENNKEKIILTHKQSNETEQNKAKQTNNLSRRHIDVRARPLFDKRELIRHLRRFYLFFSLNLQTKRAKQKKKDRKSLCKTKLTISIDAKLIFSLCRALRFKKKTHFLRAIYFTLKKKTKLIARVEIKI